MIRTALSLRKTFQYDGGWAYLDQTVTVGEALLTPPRTTRPRQYGSDNWSYVQHATVRASVPEKIVVKALVDTFSGSSCRHEHDCCGCASRSVRVKRIGKRRYLVHTSVSYNY